MDNGALDHSMEHGDGVNHGSVMALQRGYQDLFTTLRIA